MRPWLHSPGRLIRWKCLRSSHAPEPVAGEGAWQSATSFPFLAAAQEKPIAIRDVLSLLLQNAGGIVAAARPVTAKELRIHAPIESV